MSQAYKCDRCGKLFEVNLITHENQQNFEITEKNGCSSWQFDLCGCCQRALKEFLAYGAFTPDEVQSKMVAFGQHDTNIGLGETIKYSPSEVCNILEGACKNG